MKMIVMVLGLLASTAVFGDGFAQKGETGRCGAWVTNAMYGATQFMRGASREVEYIPRSTLGEMLMQAGSVASDKIYILADEGNTEVARGFVEQSTLYGYDAMSSWKSRNAGLGPSREEWHRQLMAMCLEHDAI